MTTISPDNSNEFSTFNRSFQTNYTFRPAAPAKPKKDTFGDFADYNYTSGPRQLKEVDLDVEETSMWESFLVGVLIKVVALGMGSALLILTVIAATGVL